MARKKIWLGMVVMVLAFGLTVFGCSTDSDDDDGGGGLPPSSKPTPLGSNATAQQAFDKLTEIIGYSGTPANIKTAAQTMKDT